VIAPFRAAAVQFEPRQFAKAANVASFAALVEQAAGEGAKLITTPEMGTTGYCWFDRDEVVGQVEAIPGATTEVFAEIAARRDCHTVIGMPEVEPETGRYFNSAVLIGPGETTMQFKDKFIALGAEETPATAARWPGGCGAHSICAVVSALL